MENKTEVALEKLQELNSKGVISQSGYLQLLSRVTGIPVELLKPMKEKEEMDPEVADSLARDMRADGPVAILDLEVGGVPLSQVLSRDGIRALDEAQATWERGLEAQEKDD